MAKKSVRNRNEKRIKLVNRLRAKRDQLRVNVSNAHLSEKERVRIYKIQLEAVADHHSLYWPRQGFEVPQGLACWLIEKSQILQDRYQTIFEGMKDSQRVGSKK